MNKSLSTALQVLQFFFWIVGILFEKFKIKLVLFGKIHKKILVFRSQPIYIDITSLQPLVMVAKIIFSLQPWLMVANCWISLGFQWISHFGHLIFKNFTKKLNSSKNFLEFHLPSPRSRLQTELFCWLLWLVVAKPYKLMKLGWLKKSRFINKVAKTSLIPFSFFKEDFQNPKFYSEYLAGKSKALIAIR